MEIGTTTIACVDLWVLPCNTAIWTVVLRTVRELEAVAVETPTRGCVFRW